MLSDSFCMGVSYSRVDTNTTTEETISFLSIIITLSMLGEEHTSVRKGMGTFKKLTVAQFMHLWVSFIIQSIRRITQLEICNIYSITRKWFPSQEKH